MFRGHALMWARSGFGLLKFLWKHRVKKEETKYVDAREVVIMETNFFIY